MKDNISFLVHLLLKKNFIRIDFEELNLQVQSHPSYPSLHSITEVLSHFEIDNVAIEVPVDKETLQQLPKCFLAEVEIDSVSTFAIINKIKNNYELFFQQNDSIVTSEKLFLEQFTGIMVAVERKNVTELKAKIKIKAVIYALITFLIFVCLFLFYSSNFLINMFFLLAILGLGSSVLIIQYDIGISSKMIDRICPQETGKANCSTVLNSKGAKIFNVIKLSDISFIYFTTLTISLFLILLSRTSFLIIYGLSLLAIPAIIYSLFHQLVVVKTFCLLCLTVVSILSLQVILAALIIFKNVELSFSLLSFLIVLLTFTFTVSIWLFIRPKLIIEKKYNLLKIKTNRFKRNYSIFQKLLLEKKPINPTVENTPEIVFGNLKSPLKLIVITNPFCFFCKDLHYLIKLLLNKYENQVCITIRFNIKDKDPESKFVKITTRLLEIYHNEGAEKCKQALDDIYSEMNWQSWLNSYGECESLPRYQNILENESLWCLKHNIYYTPELLLNGRPYPKVYEYEDLIYFIEELSEDNLIF